MYKSGAHAKKIISAQHDNGSWGYFHTLSAPYKGVTTEQAFRRLEFLCFDKNDECMRKALDFLNKCLIGELTIPDKVEVGVNWGNFVELMLSTWICRFSDKCVEANIVADRWASVISAAFSNGTYDNSFYVTAYTHAFVYKPKGGRLTDFVNFYILSIIQGRLDPETENAVVDYILYHENGIYYIYEKRIDKTPEAFCSKEASRYIGAIKLLSGFENSRHKLSFVADWLEVDSYANCKWDMGLAVKDGVYFPLIRLKQFFTFSGGNYHPNLSFPVFKISLV